jgi:hypothetical protein
MNNNKERNKTGKVYSVEYTKFQRCSLHQIKGDYVSRATIGIKKQQWYQRQQWYRR